jgi:hypothetical protein
MAAVDAPNFFLYFERNQGRIQFYNYLMTSENKHINSRGMSSFLQVDEKNSGMNKESLVPSELISKMTNIINQNTEMIMKQNYNIKEVKEYHIRISFFKYFLFNTIINF